jgi:peptide/nickel transport system permease protein
MSLVELTGPPAESAPAAGRRRVSWTLARRVGVAVLSIWGVGTIVFFVTRLTGDPIRLMSPPGATEQQIDSTRHYFGLDRPLYDQYWSYLRGLVHFDFGQSFFWNQGAASVVFGHFAPTIILAVISFGVTVAVALPAALVAAHRQGGWLDRIFTVLASFGIAVPQFWLGPLLIIVFAVTFRVLPASGNSGLSHYVLPVITLSAVQVAILFVLARAAMAKELRRPYIDEARSKGVRGRRLMLSHVAPNAGLELLTLTGLVLANLIAGDILVENVFAWPGIGQLLVSSVQEFDFPVIEAITLIYSAVFIGILFVVDSLYRIVDPRAS